VPIENSSSRPDTSLTWEKAAYALSAKVGPANMIGRFRDDGDLQKLHQVPIKKKPPASMRRPTAGARASGLVTIGGEAPKRAVIIAWHSLEKAQAWYNSAEYHNLLKVGQKYAKFDIFAIEGQPNSVKG
jgi:Domain of unknown function (DUF1330)